MPLNVERALQEGYPLSEIADVLAKESRFNINKARQEGYNDYDIVDLLSGKRSQAQPQAGFVPAFKSGVEGFKGDIGALGVAANVEGAEQYVKQQREKQAQIYKQPEFSEAPVSYLTGLLGQSLPYMLAPAAAGAAAFAAVPAGASALTASIASGLAAGLASGTQFTGSNISRQLEAGTAGKDVEVAKAVAAAIPQAALDTLSMRMIPGLGKIFGKAGVKMTEEELEQVAKHGLVSGMADKVRQYGPAVLKTSGVEGLTETAQQVLERAQAGLNLTDEAAKKEYYDSFLGGALLGGTLAIPGRAIERGAARQEAEQKRDERLAGERETERQKEEAYKQSDEYFVKLDTQFNDLKKQQQDLIAQRGKKPGKDADDDAKTQYNELTGQIKDLGTQLKDVAAEHKAATPRINAIKAEAERQGMTPEEYFLKQMGEKAPEEAAAKEEPVDTGMADLLADKFERVSPLQKNLDQRLQGIRYFDRMNEHAVVARHIAEDPQLAQAFVNGELKIPELNAKDIKTIQEAMPLQLEAIEEERAAEAKKKVGEEKGALFRISENVRAAEDINRRLDSERYALRNIAQDETNPVGINEKLNEIVRLLEAKAKTTVESEVKRAAKPSAVVGRRTAGEGRRTERAPALVLNEETGEYEEQKTPGDAAALRIGPDSELLRMIERFRVLQQQKGAARDNAELTELAEQIRLAAQPQRNEVIGGPTLDIVSLLEKPGQKSTYIAELDRLSKEQDEAFPAALDAVRAASEFRKKPVAPPLTGTLSAKSGSPEQRIEAESVRLDAEERKARGRFTTAVLQEIEANRRANAVPSVAKDEANLIAGRVNNMLQMAAARKFGAPKEAMDVIRDDIAKLVTQYSDVERVKGTPKRVELVGPRKPAATEETAVVEEVKAEPTEEAAPVVPYNEEPGSFLANFRQFTQTQKEEREEIKKEVKQVTAASKQEGMTAKRALDVVNAHVDAMAAKLETLVNAVRQQRRIAERSGTKSPGFAKIEADITQRLETFAEDQKKVQQYYETLKRYRGMQDQSADALVKVYNRLDKQRRDIEKQRDALKPTTPQARTALRAYNQQIAEIDKEFEEMRSGFASSGKEIDTAVTAFEKKIQSIQNFQDALADNAAIARQPALQYLKDYIGRNKAVKSALEEATGLRNVFDTLQEQRRQFISKIAGAKRAAAAIEAGQGKTAAQRVAESQAEAARQTGLGLPGTKVTRADIKSDIAEAEDKLTEELNRLNKMRDEREDMNTREGVGKQEKSALTRLIKTAEEKTVPNTESEIDSLKQEAKGMTEPAVKETSKPAGVLPASKQTAAKKEFEKAFSDFLLAKDLAREFDEEGFPVKKVRGPYTKKLTAPELRTAGDKTSGSVRTKVAKELEAPDTDAAFSIGEENTSQVDPAQAKALAEKIKAGLPEDMRGKVLFVEKFDNIEDFNKVPGKLISAMGRMGLMSRDDNGVVRAQRVKGAVLGDGTVVVFGSHHATLSELEITFAHELNGHYGVDMLLGEKGFRKLIKAVEKEYGGIMELANKFGIENEVQDAAAYYAELYQDMKKAGASREKLDAAYDKGQIQAMRELIAHIEEARADQNFMQKAGTFIKELIGALRAGLRKLGFTNMSEASTSDLYYILRKSRKSFNQRTMGAYVSPTQEISFSRKPAFNTQIDPDIAKTISTVVKGPTSIADRVKSEVTGIGARTMFVDRFAPLQNVAEYLKKSSQAMQMMYYARMHDQRMAWTASTVNDGAPTLNVDEKGNRIIKTRGGANLNQIATKLAEVKSYGNAEAVRDLFTTYLAAHRAKNKGINTLNFSGAVTPAELNKVMQLGDSIPQFVEARKMYNEYNNGLINWIAEAGAIDKAVAKQLTKDQDYIPFYRAIGDNVVMEIAGSQTITIGNIQNQPYLKELVGGDQKIQDFFTSSLQNTSMLVDMGLRNLATKEAAFSLQEAGLLQQTGTYKGKPTYMANGHGPTQPNVLRFKRDGKDAYVTVNSESIGIPSELLVKGMHGVTTTIGGFTKVLAIPAQFLRTMVTRSPVYAARQVVRDSMSNYLLAGGDMTPVASAAKELISMYAGTSAGEKALQQRGVIGGQLLTGTSEDMQKILLQLTKGGSGWEMGLAKLDRMHMKADASARITLYNSYRKQGMSDMEATLATLESMNFSKRGASGSLYALNMMVPFLNAQIQGLNVLYESFTGKLPYAEKLAVQRKLIVRGLMMAAGTVAYAAMMQDDEAYKNANLRDRLQNWFIRIPGVDEPIKVPIPFEVGLIFKALPEAVLLMNKEDEDANKVLAALGGLAAMSSPVGVSTAVPQAAKPIVEGVMNRSFYNGAEIESQREQELLPQERVRDKTSGVAKLLSGAIGAVTETAGYPTKGISPIMIDSLINGYTGGTGLAIAQMIGTLVPVGDQPAAATKRMSDLPIVGSMFQPIDAAGQITQFFDKATEYGQIKATFEKMVAEGRTEEAEKFVNQYAKQTVLADIADDFKQTMSEFTELERFVKADREMTSQEKREKLDELRQAKIEFAKAFHAASRQ
jgi:hypothetical protein